MGTSLQSHKLLSDRPKSGVISTAPAKKNKEDWASEQEQKKNEFSEKIKQLGDSYRDKPEDLAELFAFKSKFHNYSARNTMLMYLQNPGAMFVASFQHFRELGYSVEKGQHGMKIFVPVTTTLFKTDDGNIKKISEATKEEKELIKQGKIETWITQRYKLGTVFDIAQTNCPAEDYPKIIGIGFADEKAQTLLAGVMDFCQRELNCPMTITEFDNVGIRGFFAPGENRIELNSLFKDSQLLSTALHEMSHAILHSAPEAKEYPTVRKEFEADALAIMLESRLGIEITDARKSHLAQHYRKLNELTASLPAEKQSELSVDKLLDTVSTQCEKIFPTLQVYLSNSLLNSPEYSEYISENSNSEALEFEI